MVDPRAQFLDKLAGVKNVEAVRGVALPAAQRGAYLKSKRVTEDMDKSTQAPCTLSCWMCRALRNLQKRIQWIS